MNDKKKVELYHKALKRIAADPYFTPSEVINLAKSALKATENERRCQCCGSVEHVRTVCTACECKGMATEEQFNSFRPSTGLEK